MSDDDIWRLNRGGHDPHKIYTAYAAAMAHKGQPTVILAKTIKGYGMGEAGESQNITHQQKKMGTSSIRAFRDRFAIPVPDDKLEEVPYVNFAEGSPELRVHARAAAGAGRLPAGAPAQSRAARSPAAVRVRLAAQGHRRRARDVDHHGVRAHPDDAGARQEHRQIRGAHRAGRVAHLRHGRHVPSTRHLLACRPALHAAGRRPVDVLQGRQARPDSAGGHQRAGRDVVVDRGRDRLQHARRVDDPVLYFLLDVRFPARRRSGVGGGRHARARLSARRHRGPHHAERRGPAA